MDMNILDMLLTGLDREGALRDKVDDYIIDTCNTPDAGWETAIWKGNGKIVIVEHYSCKETAESRHQFWKFLCHYHPTRAFDDAICEWIDL